MTSKARRETNIYWDGTIKNGDKILIVHDVLVEGQQINDAILKIKRKYGTANIVGVVSIINRTDFDKKFNISKQPIKSLITWNDSIIDRIKSRKDN